MIEREGFKRSLYETEVKGTPCSSWNDWERFSSFEEIYGGTTLITCQQGTTPDWLKMEDGINNGLANSRIETMYLADGRGRDRWLQKVRVLTLRLCTQAVLTKLERKRHRWSSMSFHRYRIGKHIINIYHHGLTGYSQNTKFKRREKRTNARNTFWAQRS